MPTVVAPGANWHLGAHADDLISEFVRTDVVVDRTTQRISKNFTEASVKVAVASNSMNKSMRKVQLAAGVAAVGVEDFIQVFPTAGFAGGFRAAANNISQALFYLLGPMGQFIGVATTLGFILGGSFIEGLIQSSKETRNFTDEIEEAAKQAEKTADALTKLAEQRISTSTKFKGVVGELQGTTDVEEFAKKRATLIAQLEEEKTEQAAVNFEIQKQRVEIARLTELWREWKTARDKYNEDLDPASFAKISEGRVLNTEQEALAAFAQEMNSVYHSIQIAEGVVGNLSQKFQEQQVAIDDTTAALSLYNLAGKGKKGDEFYFDIIEAGEKLAHGETPLEKKLDEVKNKFKELKDIAEKTFEDPFDIKDTLDKLKVEAEARVIAEDFEKKSEHQRKFFDKIPSAKANTPSEKFSAIADDALRLREDFFKEFTDPFLRSTFDQALAVGVNESQQQIFDKESEKLSREASRRAAEGEQSTAPIEARSTEGYKQVARVFLGAQSAEAESLKLQEEQKSLQQQMADSLADLAAAQAGAGIQTLFLAIPP